MYCIFCCHCGEKSVFGRIFRCSAKRCNFQQQSVGIGLSQSHKVKCAFEQVWVARQKVISRRARKVDYSTPLCLHPVFASTPWADDGRQRQGQGQGRGRATRAGWAAPHPDQLRLPGALGAPINLPQVTPTAALGLAFLGFCSPSSSAVPRSSRVLHVLSCWIILELLQVLGWFCSGFKVPGVNFPFQCTVFFCKRQKNKKINFLAENFYQRGWNCSPLWHCWTVPSLKARGVNVWIILCFTFCYNAKWLKELS